jgi:hypothetical protein
MVRSILSIVASAFIFLSTTVGQNLFEITNAKFDWKCNAKYLNVTHEPTKHMETGNWNLQLLKDLPNLHVDKLIRNALFKLFFFFFQLHVYVKLQKSETILVNHSINLCYLRKTRNANMFLRKLMDVLTTNLDFTFKCPFKKGNYTKKNVITFTDINHPDVYIPSFIRKKLELEVVEINYEFKTKKNGELEVLFAVKELWYFKLATI